MTVNRFLNVIQEELNIDFFAGVPDSQLKALCNTIYERYGVSDKHVIAANEGAAVGLAAGHYLATGKPALVYLQNSGLGNIVNPVASLLDEKVYGIPCVFVVGWRGEPGVKDEPQHAFQGEITVSLLELLKINCFILSKDTSEEEFENFIINSKAVLSEGKSIAIIVRKGALESVSTPKYRNSYSLMREEALRVIVENAGEEDVFVSTTGKTSRELFEIREALGQGHEKDFLTVGSMGHASMIAMGIALSRPDRTVWCIDGDGAALMHLGSMVLLAKANLRNLIHIVINNGAHESVGGLPVAGGNLEFCKIAKEVGYKLCKQVSSSEQLKQVIHTAIYSRCSCFIEVLAALGSRENLGRPTTTPAENKLALMKFLSGRNDQ